MPEYIYIVVCNGLCKIGHAKNVHSRFRQIKAGCPFNEAVLHSYQEIISDKGSVAEEWCHYELRRRWHGVGEWFRVSAREASEKIKRVLMTKHVGRPVWSVRIHNGAEASRKAWAAGSKLRSPEASKKRSEARLAAWKDPKIVKKMMRRKAWKPDAAWRAKRSEAMRRFWADKDSREKIMAARWGAENRRRQTKQIRGMWKDKEMASRMKRNRKAKQ